MDNVAASQLLAVWEKGVEQHPVERAVTLLTLLKADTREALMQLSIGKRNAELFELRKLLFGESLICVVSCVSCQELLEFTLNLADFTQIHSDESVSQIIQDGFEFTFRAITSADLMAIKHCQDIMQATRQLLERCLLNCQCKGQKITVAQLPEAIIDPLAKAISTLDPQAELLFNFTCPACASQWQSLFDVAAILWEEIQEKAKQLLNEVHQLALAYSWCESDILALKPQRRQYYLAKLI